MLDSRAFRDGKLRLAGRHAIETISVADALVLVDSQTRVRREQTHYGQSNAACALRKVLVRQLGVCEANGCGEADGGRERESRGEGEGA
jgi:hypothetical protein